MPYYCEGPCQARTYCKAESLTLASTFSIWKIHLVFLQDCCSLLNGELNSSCHEFCHEITKSILQHFLEEIFLCFLVSSKGPSQLHFLFLFALFLVSAYVLWSTNFKATLYFQVVINLATQWIQTAKYVWNASWVNFT